MFKKFSMILFIGVCILITMLTNNGIYMGFCFGTVMVLYGYIVLKTGKINLDLKVGELIFGSHSNLGVVSVGGSKKLVGGTMIFVGSVFLFLFFLKFFQVI